MANQGVTDFINTIKGAGALTGAVSNREIDELTGGALAGPAPAPPAAAAGPLGGALSELKGSISDKERAQMLEQ